MSRLDHPPFMLPYLTERDDRPEDRAKKTALNVVVNDYNRWIIDGCCLVEALRVHRQAQYVLFVMPLYMDEEDIDRIESIEHNLRQWVENKERKVEEEVW